MMVFTIFKQTISLLYKLFSAGEHAFEDAAGTEVVSIFDVINAVAGDAFKGLASSFLAALLECMDANVCDFKGHLNLLDLMGGTTNIIYLVERINDY